MKKSDLIPMEHFVELRNGMVYWFLGEVFSEYDFGIYSHHYDNDMNYSCNEKDRDKNLDIVRVYQKQYPLSICLNEWKIYFTNHIGYIKGRRIKPIWDRDAEWSN